MSVKKIFGTVFGAAVATGLIYVGSKVLKEIDKIPDEDNNYRKKAQKYFAEKWQNFRVSIDDRNKQIEEIVAKLKEDVIKEVNEEKRRELVEGASRQINRLREEIKETMAARRKDLIEFTDKFKQSSFYVDTVAAITSTGEKIKEKFRKNDPFEVQFEEGE